MAPRYRERYIPQQFATWVMFFFDIWSSLQLVSTTAGMTTKQAIALEPNIPTSTITEPIFFDIMHSTREPAKISRMKGVDANVPRTAVRGGTPLINSWLKAPCALWGGQQFQQNHNEGHEYGMGRKLSDADELTWNTTLHFIPIPIRTTWLEWWTCEYCWCINLG